MGLGPAQVPARIQLIQLKKPGFLMIFLTNFLNNNN